ncbi:MAG: zf-HC2 domain-containing protein [Pseudomonadota bacterium]
MNCSRIKELFSESIDGRLDKEQEALVKEHLLLCGDCRYEFESMKAVVREMGSLDTIKAPDDFLVSLHGRIKSDSWFQKIKAFLFIPARIRIPVELATLATAVVIAFFIFHIVPPIIPPKTPLKTPSKSQMGLKDEKPAGGIQSNENAPAGSGMKSSETKGISDKSAPAPQNKQNHYDREPLSIPPSERPAVQALRAAEADHIPMPGKTGGFPAPAKINEPLQMVLVLKPVFEKEPVTEKRKDDTDLYQKKPAFSYQEGLLFNIKEHIKSAGGSILKTDINKETGQPEYLLIEISGQDYQKLVEKLGESGKIQTPPAGDVSQSKQPIQVRLHILINK